MNTFGKNLRLTTFGESHGPAIGGVIDGFPPGLKIDFSLIEAEMAARRPGRPGVSPRREPDIPEFLSGISPEGISLGTPIAFIIRNKDCRSQDYDTLKDTYRPNHADFTCQVRYGIRDHRGGGRSSARETACRVVAGAFARMILNKYGVQVESFLTGVGETSESEILEKFSANPSLAFSYCPSDSLVSAMNEEIEKASKAGDSVGGLVTGIVLNLPAGVGNPVYGKLNAMLAEAMMGINAAKGFEIGYGFNLAGCQGSKVRDNFVYEGEKISTETNYSGGIQGGISNGMPIFFNVAFKPTPSFGIPGRHDPCVAVRAVPVVKAMTALVIADFLLGSPPKSP